MCLPRSIQNKLKSLKVAQMHGCGDDGVCWKLSVILFVMSCGDVAIDGGVGLWVCDVLCDVVHFTVDSGVDCGEVVVRWRND